MELTIKVIDTESLFGYKQITTFFKDFSIADNFGIQAIKDTYNVAFKEWNSDYKYMTELVMVLNWKIWEHVDTNNEYAELYEELWEKAASYAENNLNDEELRYYYRTTD